MTLLTEEGDGIASKRIIYIARKAYLRKTMVQKNPCKETNNIGKRKVGTINDHLAPATQYLITVIGDVSLASRVVQAP
jgi:hypothetical protein